MASITVVEPNIPIPSQDGSSRRKYPTYDLEVGESFGVQPENGEDIQQIQRRVNPHLSYVRKTTGKDFTLRTLEDGVRVWRTF